MSTRKVLVTVVLATLAAATLVMPAMIGGAQGPAPSTGTLLASGLTNTIGGVIGPDGALYVPEGATTGKVTRVDLTTGATTTLVSGLPTSGFGGAIDVAFVGTTAYVLVTVVDPPAIVGIYRVDDADSTTLIADLGAYSLANQPDYPIEVATGVQFAIEPVSTGFIVSDGHFNTVLHVTMAGVITELVTFGNEVPTGLDVSGSTAYLSLIGPVPHIPADGKVVSFNLSSPSVVTTVASGVSFVVDVEVGPNGVLYALAQGDSPGIVPPGSPAAPASGKLLRVNADGTFSVLVTGLDLASSLHFVGDTAYVVTLNGEVWKIANVSALQAITPTPTATPTTVPPTATPTSAPPTTAPTATPTTAAPRPPATGQGGAGENGTGIDPWLLAAFATFVLAGGTLTLVTRKNR